MALTSIGGQLTPGRPIEITFAANLGLPSTTQNLTIIGHKDAVSGTASPYQFVSMANVADPVAAATEAGQKFGVGSELAKMVIAAVQANQIIGNFIPINCVPLASSDTGFGASNIALTAAGKFEAEFVVTPYDAQTSVANLALFVAQCGAMSSAQKVENNQFGTVGVGATMNVQDPTTLVEPDSQYLSLAYMRDTGTGSNKNAYSVGEMAAAFAAVQASNAIPFNPLTGTVINALPAPANNMDWLTIGAGQESEAALMRGWVPLRVLPNGTVAITRTRTARLTTNGIVPVTAYFDVPDFQVLYFWRKTLWTRFNQPDLLQMKASAGAASLILSEVIRLASAFEDQGMFQSVSTLAKEFVVQRNISDRSRFDVFTPVNVIPGLYVIATNVQATTEGDTLTI